MSSTILITGSTDGLGLETAKVLAGQGHDLLLHGRSEDKLLAAEDTVRGAGGSGTIERLRADLSSLDEVESLAAEVADRHDRLDVVINNAGVFRVPTTVAANGLDMRFMVNTIAPYVLTRRLLPLFAVGGRVVNLSSAAQAPVDPRALTGAVALADGTAYAQSKLAITMWSRHLAEELARAVQ